MMNAGDLPFLIACLGAAALLTVLTFVIAEKLTSNLHTLRVVSALTAPLLIAALGIGMERWNPDPHGWVLPALLLLAVICLPVTVLTSELLTRRLARRNARHG
jgi:hypothetical protein